VYFRQYAPNWSAATRDAMLRAERRTGDNILVLRRRFVPRVDHPARLECDADPTIRAHEIQPYDQLARAWTHAPLDETTADGAIHLRVELIHDLVDIVEL
jgi:hypothetical protein